MPSTYKIWPYVHQEPDMQLVLRASVIFHLPFFVQGLEEARVGSVYSGTGF